MKTEQEFKKEFYEKAEKVKTNEDFISLIEEMEKEQLDYGTIVYSCTTAMIAAFNLVNRGKSGGITGFQAGFIGWEMVGKFMSFGKDAKLRILNYNDLLFPQYENKFRNISQSTWDDIQKKAKEKLEEAEGCLEVRDHWKSIAAGNIPFGFTIGED